MADPWPPAPDLAQDFHVHSTFSDGRGTIAENAAAARAVGLRTLCLVDHVRADTDWLGDFLVATAELIETDRASHDTALEIRRGVETKVLDTAGRLDLPDGTGPLDHVLVADHQFPLDDGPHTPKEILAGRRSGRWGDAELAAALLDAMAAAVPQVAGRSGGAGEAVEDGRTGTVVRRSTDVGAAARAIEELLADPDLRERMGRASRQRAEASFDYDKLAPRLAASLANVEG